MNKQNYSEIEKKIEKKYTKKEKAKKVKMKISGEGVKKLQKIIKDK